ncbi:MAG: hypothetical protein MJA82_18670, partial [Clostridia bacterium]|nr:hypothetical protein [Clostridia bacterium]
DRNKKETKFYYGINDTQDSFGQDEARTNSIISSVEISGIVEYLMSSSDDELFNNYEYITRKYSDKQNVDILINMPDILKEKLRENDKYILYESIKNNYVSLENKDEGFTPDNSSIKEKILLKEKIVYKVPKESKLKHVTIGVGGVSTAAGTTHTLLGIAMSLVRNKSKVAVVDRSNNLSIAELYSHGKPMKSDKYFKYMDIDFYVNANSTNDIFYEIKQKDYNYVLFDLGTLKSFNKDERRVEREKNYNEMFRMNHQILCLNGSLWKSQDIIYYRCDDFANLEPNISDWKLVISFADTKQYKKLYSEIIDTTVIKKTYRAPIYNPFKPNKDYEVFMDSLLSDIMPYKNKINKEFNLLGFLKK